MRTIDEMQRRGVESRVKSSEASSYRQLPGPTINGQEISQVAIPLEYPPSRDLQPRWGSTRPPIAFLADWFDTYDYQPLLDDVHAAARELLDIPKHFDLNLFVWRPHRQRRRSRALASNVSRFGPIRSLPFPREHYEKLRVKS